MPGSEIWIIEDDKSCQYVYELALAEDYRFLFFEGVPELVAALRTGGQPSLVIADLLLKNSNFLDFFSLEESSLLQCGIIIVSSVDDLVTLRECYEEGVVDYLTKPFNKNQLLAKIEQSCKQHQPVDAPHYPKDLSVLAELQLDPRRLRVFFSDKWVSLTHKEYRILDTLSLSNNQAVARDRLLQTIWTDVKVGRKTLDVHLFHLRKKIKSIGLSILFEPPNAYKISSPASAKSGDRMNGERGPRNSQ